MNTAAEIYDLMETTGMSAPGITQALKNIGGDMQAGVKRIANYYLVEGYQAGVRIGERHGLIKGTIIGLAIPALLGTGYYLYDRYKVMGTPRMHEVEGKKILNEFKSVVTTEEDRNPWNAYAESPSETEANQANEVKLDARVN